MNKPLMSTSLPDDARPARVGHVAETSIAEEVVLFDVTSYQAFTLNPPAVAVWTRCDGTRTVAEIVAELKDVFHTEPDELERDVVAVVERFHSQNLIAFGEEAV
jgi:hypothetical protein